MKKLVTFIFLFLVLTIALVSPFMAVATPVSPTINTQTWTKAGNPYIVTSDCTVPAGQVLTIEPGVQIILGPGVTLKVEGRILAMGTQAEHIWFKGVSSSNYWKETFVQETGNGISQFQWCDFQDALNGLHLGSYNNNLIMAAEVSDCTFTNCTSSGIYGEAVGYYNGWSDYRYPTLSLVIQNCVFTGMFSAALHFKSSGTHVFVYGKVNPIIRNSIVQNPAGIAFRFEAASGSGSYQPKLFNNSVIGALKGIVTQDPYDIVAENNIFSDCAAGIERLGALNSTNSLGVQHNCFFNNTPAFVNYPQNYGLILLTNRNGDPSDLKFNIFLNPNLSDTSGLRLASNSPCIDAGNPAPEFNDATSPPWHRTNINDIGATGGPNARFDGPQPPAITVHDPTALTPTSVELRAVVSPNGADASGWFEYSTGWDKDSDSNGAQLSHKTLILSYL